MLDRLAVMLLDDDDELVLLLLDVDDDELEDGLLCDSSVAAQHMYVYHLPCWWKHQTMVYSGR